MGEKKKTALEEVTFGKDIQFIGRVLLAIGAIVSVIGSSIERHGEREAKK